MSSYFPPTYFFNGINFNSSYYVSSTSTGLTLSTGDARYLIKTTNDIASGTETFSNGILTNSILPASATAFHLNDANSSSSITHINNGNSNTGNVNIQNGSTNSGNLNLQTGTGSGLINIGRPLTVTYLSSDITASSQIGYQATITGTSLANLGTTATNAGTVVTLTSGVWQVSAVLVLTSFQTGNQQTTISLSTSNSSIDNKRITVLHSNSAILGILYVTVNSIFSVSASTPIYLTGLSSGTNTNSGIIGYYTRLA